MTYKNIVPKSDELTCMICNEQLNTARARNKHLKVVHQLTYEQYIMSYYFNNEYPKCKCGCGTKMIFIKSPFGIWFADYATNHFPRKNHTEETKAKIKKNTLKAIQDKFGVDNIMELSKYKDKIKEVKKERYDDENYNNPNKNRKTKLAKYGDETYNNYKKSELTKLRLYGYKYYIHNRQSKIELEVLSGLDIANDNVIGGFIINDLEYDIKIGNNIYEIDGDYWHPSQLQNLTFQQLNNVVNDHIKMQIVDNSDYTLYRVHTSSLPKDITNITETKLQEISYVPNRIIANDQIIVNKQYIEKYITNKGFKKLKYNLRYIIKFIRTFVPQLSYLTDDILLDRINDLVGVNGKPLLHLTIDNLK